MTITIIEIRDNFGEGDLVKTTTLRWAMTNDDRNIYIALEWTDDTYDHVFDLTLGPQIFDGVKLLFDNCALEDGEDERTVIAASVGSMYVDQHVVACGGEIRHTEGGQVQFIPRCARDGR